LELIFSKLIFLNLEVKSLSKVIGLADLIFKFFPNKFRN
jgi:hypothetical protein